MQFHWLRDRMTQLQFGFHWRSGTSNLVDYWTKHHSAKHHRSLRRKILTPVETVRKFFQTAESGDLLQGCVELIGAH